MVVDPVIGVLLGLMLLWALVAVSGSPRDPEELALEDTEPSLFELLLLGVSIAYIIGYIQKYRSRRRLVEQHQVEHPLEGGDNDGNP